jgi:hypothetical protein
LAIRDLFATIVVPVMSEIIVSCVLMAFTDRLQNWAQSVSSVRAVEIRVIPKRESVSSAKATRKAGDVSDARKDSSVIQVKVAKSANASIPVQSITCAIPPMESAHASQIMPGNYVINVPLDMQMFPSSAHPASATRMDPRSTGLVMS